MTVVPENHLWTRNFAFLTVANLLMAIAFYFMTPIMPLFMTDRFGSGTGDIGWVMVSFTIAAILMRPFSGFLLDSFRRYTVYVVCYIAFMLVFLGYPVAGALAVLVVLRFMHGLTWGSMNTAAYTLAVDFIPQKRRGEGLGFFGMSMTVAMAVGPMIAMAIVGKGGYNTLFYSAVAFSAVGLMLIFTLRPPKIEPVKPRFTLKGLFEKSAIPVSVTTLMTQIPYGGIISFIALYGRKIGVMNSGSFFLIFSVSIAVARVLSGRIYDKTGPKKVALAGLLLLVAGLLLIGYFPVPAGFHAAGVVLGFGFGILGPAFQAMINYKVAAERRGAANSTYLMFFDSGVGVGMLLFGLLIDRIGYAGTFYATAFVEVLAIIVFLTVSLPSYRKTDQNR